MPPVFQASSGPGGVSDIWKLHLWKGRWKRNKETMALKKTQQTSTNNVLRIDVKKAGMEESWSSEHESAIFQVMISFDEKPRPTYQWSRSLRVKHVSLHNERLGSRILKTMSWILCNKKNMANVPRTMNEIKIKRQETNKKTIKQISTPSLYVEISQKKNTETVHI